MVTKRELADAQQALNRAVGDLFTNYAVRDKAVEIGDHLRTPDFTTDPNSNQWAIDWVDEALKEWLQPLNAAYFAWFDMRVQLDGQGPAVARSTSIAAAKSTIMLKQSKRREILTLLVAHYQRFHDGLTADQILARMQGKHQSISARVSELANTYGLIKDSGRKRNTSLGKSAIVWEPTQEAIDLVAAAVTGRAE